MQAFDATDLRHPVIEPSGAFVMTRRITVKAVTSSGSVISAGLDVLESIVLDVVLVTTSKLT